MRWAEVRREGRREPGSTGNSADAGIGVRTGRLVRALLNALPGSTRRVLSRASDVAELQDHLLIGGTAMTLGELSGNAGCDTTGGSRTRVVRGRA